MYMHVHVHIHRSIIVCLLCCLQTEKARHILQVRQKKLDMIRLRRGVEMPSDQELSKLSDEHKAMLAQKCVDLLMRKVASSEEGSEVCVQDTQSRLTAVNCKRVMYM